MTNNPESMQELELLVPEAPEKASKSDAAPYVDTLDGKKVGLFWNLKPNGEVFLGRARELVKERFKDVEIFQFQKPDATIGASPSVIKEVVEKCDAVILSTSD